MLALLWGMIRRVAKFLSRTQLEQFEIIQVPMKTILYLPIRCLPTRSPHSTLPSSKTVFIPCWFHPIASDAQSQRGHAQFEKRHGSKSWAPEWVGCRIRALGMDMPQPGKERNGQVRRDTKSIANVAATFEQHKWSMADWFKGPEGSLRENMKAELVVKKKNIQYHSLHSGCFLLSALVWSPSRFNQFDQQNMPSKTFPPGSRLLMVVVQVYCCILL